MVDLDVDGNSPVALALRSGHHRYVSLSLQVQFCTIR